MKFKMNKQFNKVLLILDKFMGNFNQKQPRFSYSTCESNTEHRERIQKFRETGNLKHLYRNKLDEACFSHDAAYS